MGLVEQWRDIRAELPADWADARIALIVPNSSQRSRAAALLGPAGPGIAGDELRVTVSRTGSGIGPDRLAKLLRKIDQAWTRGRLRLLDVGEREARVDTPRLRLADAWAQAVAALPPDWSDLYCELELTSSDHLQRAALLLAPVNPARVPGRSAYRFRVAHTFGYGASPQMTVRCFERLDQEGIPGRLTILHVLSDTHNVDTQGPVWRVGGKAV
jgi:catechol 2,3-dioxygenase-like lactoylglutathione lyase family enzyme